MKRSNKKLAYFYGKFAEVIALIYLKAKLYKIVTTNYRNKNGEIDIIAIKSNIIIFVEVKARKNFKDLIDPISTSQKNRIVQASQIYLSNNRNYLKHAVRYDSVRICPTKIIHLKNNW